MPWRAAMHASGVEVCVLAAGEDGRVDLGALMALLGERGVQSLLVEGGGVYARGHVRSGTGGQGARDHRAEDCGGRRVRAAVAGPGARHMVEAITLRDVEVVPLGADVAFVGYV